MSFVMISILISFSSIFQNNHVLANEGLELKIISNLKDLKKSKPYDCDSLVKAIRVDSRRYLDLDGYSIEQIEDRIILNDTDTLIQCEGIAVLSNTSRSKINYKSFKDPENDWIIEYGLIN